ncbi:MAG TPA: hypothetical protein VF559_03015 [Caulobacteraceae bacterium]
MRELLSRLGRGELHDLAEVDQMMHDFPLDPRLHFLHASLLAGQRRYEEARAGMAEAVRLAPDYEIARFQLGFLHFTSGFPQEAAATWEPLADLAPEHPLRFFSLGLNKLACDEFTVAIECLTAGTKKNQIYPSLNKDMNLIIETVRTQLSGEDQQLSPTQALLRQYREKTKH